MKVRGGIEIYINGYLNEYKHRKISRKSKDENILHLGV
jgi:hypothetical protein